MALFGVTGDDIHITKDKENALAFATLIARRRIILECKSPMSLWLSDVMFFLKTEKNIIISQRINQNILQNMGSFNNLYREECTPPTLSPPTPTSSTLPLPACFFLSFFWVENEK